MSSPGYRFERCPVLRMFIYSFFIQNWGNKVPHPFARALYGTKPTDLLQIYCTEAEPSTDSVQYVLLLIDDNSGYSSAFQFSATTTGNDARAIITQNLAFGNFKSFRSDVPAHFKNEIILKIIKRLNVHQSITLSYCSGINGFVARLGSEMVGVFRSVLSEMKLSKE